MNILNMLYTLRFSPQNAICFIMLTSLVSVLFTFYIQGVLILKKNNYGTKGVNKPKGHNITLYAHFVSCLF